MTSVASILADVERPGAAVLREILEGQGRPQEMTDWQAQEARKVFEDDSGVGLWLFGYLICGLDKLTTHLHLDMCAVLSMWGKPGWERLMVMVPRGSFKTSLGSKALPLWLATRDPEVTIGIFNAAQEQAKSWIGSIRQIVEQSFAYQRIWPERLPPGIHYRERTKGKRPPKSWRWGESGLLFQRTSLAVSEPTFEPWGIGGASTGKHYTHRIMDDLVGETAAESPALIEDAIHFVDHARALERPPNGGCELVNCTPWAYRDPYSHLLTKWSGEYRLYRRSLLENPLTGEADVVEGVSIFPESISTEKARQMAQNDPYVFSCLPPDTKILMEDWSERPISTLQEGDRIVGFRTGNGSRNYRSRLVPAVVEAVVRREKRVKEYQLEDGTSIRCTDDHRWYTGATDTVSNRIPRRPYTPISSRPCSSNKDPRQNHLVRIREPIAEVSELSREQLMAAGYLAAIFDGEGHVSSGRTTQVVVASQSETKNPEVCERIRKELKTLGIEWYEGKGGLAKTGPIVNFYLAGIQERYKFLKWCNPSRNRQKIIDSLYSYYKTKRPRVVAERELGIQPVYAIQTSTRNYVAELCLSSNSQYQCIPRAGRETSFDRDWLRTFEVVEAANGEICLRIPPSHFDPQRVSAQVAGERAPDLVPLHWCDRAILVDPAPTKKGEKSSEPQARNGLVAVAQDPWGRMFCLQSVGLREDPLTVMTAMTWMSVFWGIDKVGIEEVNFSRVYAPLWNVILRQRHPELEFRWVSLMTKGEDKDVRIRSLLAPHREGLWYYYEPRCGHILQELLEYPNGETRDLIDALAYTRQALSRPMTPDEEQLSYYQAGGAGRDKWTAY